MRYNCDRDNCESKAADRNLSSLKEGHFSLCPLVILSHLIVVCHATEQGDHGLESEGDGTVCFEDLLHE